MVADFKLWWNHEGRNHILWWGVALLVMAVFYGTLYYIKAKNTEGAVITHNGRVSGDVITAEGLERYSRMMKPEIDRVSLGWSPHFFSGMPGVTLASAREQGPEYFWIPIITAILVFYCCLTHFAKYGWLIALIIVGLMSQIVVGEGWRSWTMLDAIFLIVVGITTQTESDEYKAERKANHEWYARNRH